MAYARPSAQALWVIAGLVVLLAIAFFTVPVLLTRATVKTVQSPAAAEQTTQDRNAAKSEIPK
jgi:hypothetical protein